jgi:hypothetical protein
MTFEQLEKWAAAQGKTTDDMVRWLAVADAIAYQEMTTRDFVRELMDGIPKYDREFLCGHWESLDEEEKRNYLVYMKDQWSHPDSDYAGAI